MDLAQRRQRDQVIGGMLALVPDALIGLAIMKLHDNEWSTFWWTVAILQFIYFLGWAKRAVWASIVWRLWGRKRTTENFVEALKLMKAPSPEVHEDDAQDYFARVRDDPEQPTEMRITAAQSEIAVTSAAAQSLQSSLQLGRAWRDALRQYREGIVDVSRPL